VVFIGFAFPNWLPEGYYKYKVLTLHPTLNGTAPMIHKPQEDPASPAEGTYAYKDTAIKINVFFRLRN